jgi:hypothetical protein
LIKNGLGQILCGFSKLIWSPWQAAIVGVEHPSQCTQIEVILTVYLCIACYLGMWLINQNKNYLRVFSGINALEEDFESGPGRSRMDGNEYSVSTDRPR